MNRVLKSSFFEQPTITVARSLLGKFLVCARRGQRSAGMIVDVEAYDGPEDKASHAHRGQTPRNAPMFGPPGVWYVYLCYGTHWMLNIVTGKEGYPAAVLLRGLEDVEGKRIVGPGRVTKALGIDQRQNNLFARRATGLWVEDRGVVIPPREIKKSPRIGVDYAGSWAKKPFRFTYNRHGTFLFPHT